MKKFPSLTTAEGPEARQPAPPHLPIRILVVDDDADIRRLNTTVLQDSGYDVDGAADGAAAWEALKVDHYDLLITDNNMPKLTGVELLQKMRAARMFLPVIIASGTYFPPESESAEAAPSPWCQPDAALLKPYTIAALLLAVKKILSANNPPPTEASPIVRQLKSPHPTFAAAAPSGFPRAAHRILVADEDQDLRQMYAEILAGSNCRVDGVADGVAGWEALQTNRYQLLITEHDLPKLTGVELIRKARAAHLALPIVMVANRLSDAELICDPAMQLAATLMKPFAMDTLLNTVNPLLRPAAPALASGFGQASFNYAAPPVNTP